MLQEDTLDALVRSGVETIWVGAESGAQKILDSMDKGTTVEQIYEATRLMKEKGIKVGFFIQFGYLGENQGRHRCHLKNDPGLDARRNGDFRVIPLARHEILRKSKGPAQGKTKLE